MRFDNDFFENLKQLETYRGTPSWKDFFDSVTELEELEESINDEMHEESDDTSELVLKAQNLTAKLDGIKADIAKQTADKIGYDAVFKCIDYLTSHFNSI